MLFYHLDSFCKGTLGLMAIVTACAMYAYYVDSKRPDDDPKKRNYHPLAILFAPITFPLLVVLSISFFLLRMLVYGVFMVIFILALIIVRKPFILEAIRKTAIRIGDYLMEANTTLVRFFLNPWTNSRESS
jgi:hypothetical protein